MSQVQFVSSKVSQEGHDFGPHKSLEPRDLAASVEVLQGVAQLLMDRSAHGAAMIRLHGQSRGASAVCAFLMVAKGLSVGVAWRAFCYTKVQLDPNLVWWEALRRLCKVHLKHDLALVKARAHVQVVAAHFGFNMRVLESIRLSWPCTHWSQVLTA